MSYLEKEILGCFIKDNTLIKDSIIQPHYFSNSSFRKIYESMVKLSNENKDVDRVTLLADNYDHIQKLGGPSFILELETTGEFDHFESYEQKLIDDYKQRESERITKDWLSKENKDNQQSFDYENYIGNYLWTEIKGELADDFELLGFKIENYEEDFVFVSFSNFVF